LKKARRKIKRTTGLPDKKVNGDSLHGFTKGDLCLINPITSHDEITCFVSGKTTVDDVHLD